MVCDVYNSRDVFDPHLSPSLMSPGPISPSEQINREIETGFDGTVFLRAHVTFLRDHDHHLLEDIFICQM